MAGGMVIWLPEEDRTIMTKSEFLDNVTSMLAGRVAEQLVFGEMSTGAQDDLEKATGTVRRMIMEYGMSEHLGPVTFGNKEEQVFLGRDIARNRNYSEEIAYAIDKETRSIMDDCYHKAEDLLKNSMQKLNKLAELLLERETIRGEELYKLMNDEPPANPPSAPKLNFRPQEG
jgi:cell division protease FtsH